METDEELYKPCNDSDDEQTNNNERQLQLPLWNPYSCSTPKIDDNDNDEGKNDDGISFNEEVEMNDEWEVSHSDYKEEERPRKTVEEENSRGDDQE